MNRRPGEVALYLRSGTLHPLEEFDLVAGGDGDDGLAPGRSPTLDAHLADTATLLLRLRRQHVDAEHGDLEELLDGGLDLELVGVVVDGEGVLRVLRVVHRLLADDRSQDDLGGEQRVCVQDVDGVERIGQDDLDPRQVARAALQLLVAPGGDDEHPTGCPEIGQVAHELAGLHLVHGQVLDDLHGAVGELRRERAAQGEALHAPGHLLLVAAGVRAEDDAAALVVRGADGALAGAAGALLLVRLPAAARDLAARLRVVRPEVAAGQLRIHDLVHHGGVHRRREEPVGQLDRTDLGARLAIEGRAGHDYALLTRTRAFRAPGTEPLTRSRLRSASVRTTVSFLIVRRSSPMWPAMARPR